MLWLNRPKPMNYKGKEVKNVFHLQTPEDANSIARLANNKNAVIVGTSFVGETTTHLLIKTTIWDCLKTHSNANCACGVFLMMEDTYLEN